MASSRGSRLRPSHYRACLRGILRSTQGPILGLTLPAHTTSSPDISHADGAAGTSSPLTPHTPHPVCQQIPRALPADKHPLPPALWPPLSKPLSSLTSQTATGASETGLPTAAFPPAVCRLHSQTTFASRISCQLWPQPSKGSSSHFEQNPDSFYRAFQGRPCPPPQPPATRGSRTPDILAFCSSSDIGSSSTLSALPLFLSGMLFSWLPPGLYSNDTSSRRPSLTAPYTLKPTPTPMGLYPLHCFVFLQSTSQPLALHGPLPVVLSPARS